MTGLPRVEGQQKSTPCLAVVQQRFHANVFAVFIQVKLDLLVQLFLVIRHRGHVIVYPGNQNIPLVVQEGACFDASQRFKHC